MELAAMPGEITEVNIVAPAKRVATKIRMVEIRRPSIVVAPVEDVVMPARTHRQEETLRSVGAITQVGVRAFWIVLMKQVRPLDSNSRHQTPRVLCVALLSSRTAADCRSGTQPRSRTGCLIAHCRRRARLA